jgi:polysaccharide biosynthesis/export protein
MTSKRLLAIVVIAVVASGFSRTIVASGSGGTVVASGFSETVVASGFSRTVVASGFSRTNVADRSAQATQKPAQPASNPAPAPAAKQVAPAVPTPPGYVIGPDDVLQVLFWREKDLSADVTVRPDGMISLPLLNDLPVSGLTPDQLREKVTEAAKRFVEDPSVTVVVKEIKSRRVFITGQVAHPGPYPLTAPTSVLQLIATAGGLTEFADSKNITIMRTENGRPVSLPFNYRDVTKRKNLQQNIELRPGDTVIVP